MCSGVMLTRMAGRQKAPQAAAKRQGARRDAAAGAAYAMPMLRLAAAALALALVVAVTPAAAQMRCLAVDGDTLRCGAERVRVVGLDAPELHGRCPREVRQARAARDRLAELVAAGITLQPRGRDRYRRLLAVVRDRQGRDVAAVLVREGLARPYYGRGARAGWC